MPLRDCPHGRKLLELSEEKKNIFDKLQILQTLQSLACGQRSQERICCDKENKVGT